MSGGRLAGRVALVTGGAAGIGRATCLRLAAEGAVVVVADVDEEGGQETVGLTSDAGGEAHGVTLDVTDESGWKHTVDRVVSTHGALDVLVNNAGLPYRRLLPESSLEDWHHLMAVNAGGTFLGMKHGSRAIADSGGGAIVNVSSAAALTGVPGMTSYTASKGAVRAMSRAVAIEYAAAGVRVNSVYPTSVHTAMLESDAHDTDISVAEFVQAATAMSPLGRLAEPADVADAVLFLASGESRFITGAELVLDGGAIAGVS